MVTSNDDSIPTPVVQNNRLLISGLMYELDANQPNAKVLWPESRAPAKRLLSNTSSPMIRGDYVYSARSSGELICLAAGTGDQIWGTTNVTELKFGASIHLTPNGDITFLFTDEGNLILARLTPEGITRLTVCICSNLRQFWGLEGLRGRRRFMQIAASLPVTSRN